MELNLRLTVEQTPGKTESIWKEEHATALQIDHLLDEVAGRLQRVCKKGPVKQGESETLYNKSGKEIGWWEVT
tara:strand:- start:334 stop:552 length:219 start_codon:yes stop_codon:yes gene_type:complete